MFKIETGIEAPKPRQRHGNNPALYAALLALENGQSFEVPTSEYPVEMIRSHVAKASRDENAKVAFVVRANADKTAMRVFGVAKATQTANAPAKAKATRKA